MWVNRRKCTLRALCWQTWQCTLGSGENTLSQSLTIPPNTNYVNINEHKAETLDAYVLCDTDVSLAGRDL